MPDSYPHSLEAERALLGQVLSDPALLRRHLAAFEAKWFYRPDHANLYTLLRQMTDRGQIIDPVTLPRYLHDNLENEQHVGGIGYVLELFSYAPSTANCDHYAEVIRDLYVRRRVISEAEALMRRAQVLGGPIEELQEEAVGAMRTILGEGGGGGEAATIGVATTSLLEQAERSAEAMMSGVKRDQLILTTGYPFLDDAMGGGFARGTLNVLAGRPGMGKTALMGELARLACEDAMLAPEDHPVEHTLLVSLEMTREEMASRLIARLTGIDHRRIFSGNLSQDEWPSVLNAEEALKAYPLLIWDRKKQSMNAIIAAIYATAAKVPLRMVALDYAQIIRVVASDRRDLALGDAIIDFKDACAEVGAVAVLLSQFGRSLKSTGGIPSLGALKESGGLEEHSDVVIGLDRPALRGEDYAPHWIYFYGLKSRGSGPFTLEGTYKGESMKIDVTGEIGPDGETFGGDGRPEPPPVEA